MALQEDDTTLSSTLLDISRLSLLLTRQHARRLLTVTTCSRCCRSSSLPLLLPLQPRELFRPLTLILLLVLPHLPNNRALCANLLAVPPKDDGDRDERELEQAAERPRPLGRHGLIHGRARERQRAAKHASHDGVAGQRGGGVDAVRAGEIVGPVDEGDCVARAKGDAEGDGDGPVDRGGEAGPGEDELAYGGEDGADGHHAGGGFGRDTAGDGVLWVGVDDAAEDGLADDGEDGANADADEGEARDAGAPAAVLGEDYGVGDEAEVEDAVDE